MRRVVLSLTAAALAASAADARPIAMGDVVKSALDAACEKVVSGGLAADAVHDAFVRGWTGAGGGAQAKSGHWGLVRVSVTANPVGKATSCRVTGVGKVAPDTLDSADYWAARHGLRRDGEPGRAGAETTHRWRSAGGQLRMRAELSGPAAARTKVEIVLERVS